VKICFIAPGYDTVRVLSGDSSSAGGAESQMAYIAADLAALGIPVTVVYGDGARGQKRELLAGVECIEAFPNWRRPLSLVQFFTVLLQSRASHFFSNLPDDFMFVAALARLLRSHARVVYAVSSDAHCNPWRAFDYQPWFHGPLYALGLRAADFVTVQHKGQAAAIKRFVRGPVSIVPNLLRRIDDEPRPFDHTSFDALWIGAIRPEKQLALFLDIASQLCHRRFAVIGGFDARTLDSGARMQLTQRMAELTNLTFHGALRHDDIQPLLRNSKMLVNTSRYEGFPNTMLEAWSAGVPVVSLNVDPGGIISREAIGLVSGTFTQLLRDVERLSATRELNDKLGGRGFMYVQDHHSLGALCDALEPVIPGIAARFRQQQSKGSQAS
jgi:glycosyltransferase involved in cell wall biosynthesis